MSNPSPARIKINFGQISIEYEGEQSFITNGLLDFADAAHSMFASNTLPGMSFKNEPLPASDAGTQSTNTIAQIISAKTGTDLALAAIARINLIKRNSIASRSEILDEMKEATTYFKESYSSNLTAYLDTLVRSRKVNLVSKSNYALAAGERARFEEALLGE